MDYFVNVLSTLNVVGPLLSMEGQKSVRFHQKYMNFCFTVESQMKVLRVCNNMRVSN